MRVGFGERKRIAEIREWLQPQALRTPAVLVTIAAGEFRDLLDTADEAARPRAENRRLVVANNQWRADAIAREQGRGR